MSAAVLLRPLVLLMACLCAKTAQAEAWNYLSGGPGGQRAAAVCDLGDSGLTCLSLLCSDRQELGLAFQSSRPLSVPVEATVSVDGGTAQFLRFAPPVAPGAPGTARAPQARGPFLCALPADAAAGPGGAAAAVPDGRGTGSRLFRGPGGATCDAQAVASGLSFPSARNRHAPTGNPQAGT